MVEWIGSIASVEALDEIADSIIVVIEVIEVIDSIIVVVFGIGLLKVESVSWVGQENGGVGDLALV